VNEADVWREIKGREAAEDLKGDSDLKQVTMPTYSMDSST
jgi:hypothetical protein